MIRQGYDDFKQLIADAKQWKQAVLLKKYIKPVEQVMANLADEDLTWLECAKKKQMV